MDSKFNEYLIYNDQKQYSRFPDFVYSWLNNFEYEKFKVQANSAFDDKDVLTYFKFVQKTSSQLWEMLTFKEFLDDGATSDEIYFYLYIRNILCKGSLLSDTSANFYVEP